MAKSDTRKIRISGSEVTFYFGGRFSQIQDPLNGRSAIFVTDEHIFKLHQPAFRNKKTIVIPPGEKHKQQFTVDTILKELVVLGADRSTLLIGVGGGVVTDIAGYVASVFMRGIPLAFVPTTLLAMVDAAIGGKNGVDLGVYKNLVGSFRQPEFLFYDTGLLSTLPHTEWANGFAEIIKHAAIDNRAMFKQLLKHDLPFFRQHSEALSDLIRQNALLKTKIVRRDPFEKGGRKLLNFGHTLGHAIENDLQIPHGHAVAVGMVYAAELSKQLLGFQETADLIETLERYELPTHAAFNMPLALERMMTDKKRVGKEMHFVLLESLGKGVVKNIPVKDFKRYFSKTAAY